MSDLCTSSSFPPSPHLNLQTLLRAPHRARSVLLGLALLLSALSPHTTYAQRSPQEAEATVARLVRDASSYYDNLELELMDEALEQVIAVARRFGTPTPRMQQDVAQAYLLKGVGVFVNDSQDKAGARRFFVKAIQTLPSVQLDYKFSSPALKELFQEARSEATPPSYGAQANPYGAQPNPYGAPPQGQPNPYGAPPQAQPNPYGAPPQAQPNPYGAPPQGQPNPYGAPPQGQPNPYGAPPQGQPNPYGAPPQAQPNPYGAPPQGQPNPYGAPPQGQPAGAQAPDISHTPPRNLAEGAPFNVRLRVSQFLRPQVAWVRLFYQTINTNGAQRLDMRPVSALDFEGVVPGNFITGDRVQYYIVVYNQADAPIASYKNNREPEAVRISQGRYGGLVGGGGLVEQADPSAQNTFITLSFLPGTGAGTLTEFARLQRQKSQRVQPGLAFSPFHINLELDLKLGENFELGAFSRVQIVEFAVLGGLQLHYHLLNTLYQKFSLRAGGGYGRVRHLVSLNILNPQTGVTETVLDTTLEGPLSYKLGFAYSYRLTDSLNLKTAVDFTHLIAMEACTPDQICAGDSPSLHFDLNIGLSTSF